MSRLAELRGKFALASKRPRDDEPAPLGEGAAPTGAQNANAEKREEHEQEEDERKSARDDDDDDEAADAPVYALINQLEVLDTVLAHHAHALQPHDVVTLRAFRALSPGAQTVWARLHPRKYRLFRRPVRVPRMSAQAVEAALCELADAGFATLLHAGSTLALAERPERARALLRLLRAPEMRALGAANGIAGAHKMARALLLDRLCALVTPPRDKHESSSQTLLSFAGNRQADRAAVTLERTLLHHLVGSSSSLRRSSTAPAQRQGSLLAMWKRQPSDPSPVRAAEPAVALEQGVVVLGHRCCELWDRVAFLFFLNQSDFHALSLARMGAVRYAPYTTLRHPIFRTHDDLVRYLHSSHAVDMALRLTGAVQDVSSYQSTASAATEVPIPGRSLRLGPDDTAPATLRTLIALACVDLVDGAHVDASRDPLAALCVEASVMPLADELAQLRAAHAPHRWNAWLSDMIARESEALSVFEPPQQPQPSTGVVQEAEKAAAEVEALPSALFLRRYRQEYAQLYLLRVAVDWLEKQRDYALAITLLRVLLSIAPSLEGHVVHKRGSFWLRLSMDCTHLKLKEAALSVAQLALADASLPTWWAIKLQQRVVWLTGGKKSVLRFPLLERLGTLERLRITGTLLTRVTGRKSAFEGVDGDAVSVEELVLQHFSMHGNWSGLHCENSLWRSLVVVLLWDIVYDDTIPFVWQTPFQASPMDLYTPFFYSTRRGAIDARVRALREDAELTARDIRRIYALHFGTVSGVSWDAYGVELLVTIAGILGPTVVAELCMYAARDFRAFSKGLPDLCVYRLLPSPQLALVEVKGPRDRLSPEQESHLIALNDTVGIRALVCHVSEARAGANHDSDDDGDDGSDAGNGKQDE